MSIVDTGLARGVRCARCREPVRNRRRSPRAVAEVGGADGEVCWADRSMLVIGGQQLTPRGTFAAVRRFIRACSDSSLDGGNWS